jgi:large subunit ribosomal protein L21
MLAVIATGGKQYLVTSGQTLKIEKILGEAGGSVAFDKVLLTANDDGSNVKVGAPYLEGVTVKATLVKQGKNRTVRVEKFKRKVRYHKVHGQRQRFTEVKIA